MFTLSSPFGLAPMAGLTDTAFRRLVKRQGGCGLVVTEMVSSEGLVRGIDRTLEYAEFTEDERPVAVQIFGGDPEKMALAARVVERIGADAVDVNMGCPVPKVAKGRAGCSLMRDPDQAAAIVHAMARAVSIPITVKMRAGWDERETNAPELARILERAGASAITVHGRTAAQAYGGRADWELIDRVARSVSIPVFGNGDCVEPGELVQRLNQTGVAGVLAGRGALRNPWIFAQAAAAAAGRPLPEVSGADRRRFLLDYIDLLLDDLVDERAGYRHTAAPTGPRTGAWSDGDGRDEPPSGETSESGESGGPARGRQRWVINKLRALCTWYTRGFHGGSHLRVAVNHTDSIHALRQEIVHFFS
jgi:tRNA-dihydrouridine synthase B